METKVRGFERGKVGKGGFTLIELVKIKRGVYVAPNEYRILPFRELDYLAYAVQQGMAEVAN